MLSSKVMSFQQGSWMKMIPIKLRHRKCAAIKIKRPPARGIGVYNIPGMKSCSYCCIFTSDKVCPSFRCPCCGKKFKRKSRWKQQSANYGGKVNDSKIVYIEKTRENARKVGKLNEVSNNRKYR